MTFGRKKRKRARRKKSFATGYTIWLLQRIDPSAFAAWMRHLRSSGRAPLAKMYERNGFVVVPTRYPSIDTEKAA